MTSEQFAYWLQGFVELYGSEPTAEQWQSIKDHLKTVFVKVTPEVKIGSPYPGLDQVLFPDSHRVRFEPKITCGVYPAESRWHLADIHLSGKIEHLASKTRRYN
ncbi:hypothetical protein [Pseudomonas nicosulfuronedens]